MSASRLSQIIEPALGDLGFELVRISLTGGSSRNLRNKKGGGGGRQTLQIMAEPIERREMTVEDCAKISRHVAALLDVEDPITEAYQLEVSSPGIERPLTRFSDFDRFAGELVKINLKKMIDGRKRFRGRLAGTEDDKLIHLDTGFGRVSFAMADIDTAKIDATEYFSTPKRDA